MLWTAFILGLAGSVHCAGMCGPLALAVGGVAGSRGAPLVGCVAYNLGRVVTYLVLGLVFGIVGGTLVLLGVQRWVSIAVGAVILTGVLFRRRWAGTTTLVRSVGFFKRQFARVLGRPTIWSLGLLGLLNGWLPCGLVYAAGGAAVATGGWMEGAEYMAVFGFGTLPMMLGLTIFGKAVPFVWRLRLQRLTPVVLGVTALLLILRGLELGIPYLSPAFSGGAARCH